MFTLILTLSGALMVLSITVVPTVAEKLNGVMNKREARRPALPIRHSHRRISRRAH